MVKQVLRIIIPRSILVKEVVIAHVHAYILYRCVLNTDCQLGRHILVHLLTIAELIDSGNLAGLVYCRLVLHTYLCLELIFGSEVKRTYLIVQADNRGNAHTRLVAQQIHAL